MSPSLSHILIKQYNVTDITNTKYIADGSMHWNHTSYAMQIEIASYALLTYTLKNERDTGLQILNWLVKRRNSNGGFSSTQV